LESPSSAFIDMCSLIDIKKSGRQHEIKVKNKKIKKDIIYSK
jgi:hypothetical protein